MDMGLPDQMPYTLDSVDRSLLRELQTDPRISIRGLARAIGMSAGAVGERLERLESRGVVRGYRVDIDPAALGIGLEALIGIELAQHQSVLETMHTLREVPEVSQVELVTGRWDLVVRLRLRDPQHLKDILTHDVWNIQNVRHSESMIVLESLTHEGMVGLEGSNGDE
jgi:Lrp/AsnC family leucine-responsive transcriptional regulator